MLTASALLWTQIGAAVCIAITLNLLWGLYRARSRAAAARNWPIVPGTVIASAVERPAPHEADDTDCTPAVRFRYRVANRDFEGTRVRDGGPSATSLLLAEQVVAKYPPGSQVDVAYDPNDPSVAVLEPADKGHTVTLIVFAVLFAAISAVLTAHALSGKVLTTAGGFPLFGFVLPFAAIAAGLGGIVSFVAMRRRAQASATWPAAPGKITLASIVTEQIREKHDDRPDSFIAKYRPDIRYSYRVDDRDYHGNTVSFGWTALYGEPASADEILAKYPLGAPVRVFYDPARPRDSVLEPRSRQGSLAPLTFGLIFGTAGVMMLWVFTAIG